MRKNVKKQLALRVLSTAALVAMVSSIATAAFAAEYNVAEGSVEIVAKDGIQSITQRDDTGAFVKDENGAIDHRPDSKIVLVTKDETTGETKPTSNTVTITAEEKGDTANVTLKDVFINREGARNSDAEAALTVKGDGDTNIELNGNNTLSSTGGHAGLEKTDAECSGTLTITDDKNNDTSDKRKDEDGYSTGGDTGTLNVIGGGQGGAGIGGQGTNKYWDSSTDPGAPNIHSTSNITITGGSIRAGKTPTGCDRDYHWATGAGIGSGNADYSKMAPISPSPAMPMWLLRVAAIQPVSVAVTTAMAPTSSFPVMPKSLQAVQCPVVLVLAVVTVVQAAFSLQTMPM